MVGAVFQLSSNARKGGGLRNRPNSRRTDLPSPHSCRPNNRLPLRSRTSSAPAPSDSFADAPGTVLAIRPCTLDNRKSGQRAMPNISDVPIDWANVDWLYVI